MARQETRRNSIIAGAALMIILAGAVLWWLMSTGGEEIAETEPSPATDIVEPLTGAAGTEVEVPQPAPAQ